MPNHQQDASDSVPLPQCVAFSNIASRCRILTDMIHPHHPSRPTITQPTGCRLMRACRTGWRKEKITARNRGGLGSGLILSEWHRKYARYYKSYAVLDFLRASTVNIMASLAYDIKATVEGLFQYTHKTWDAVQDTGHIPPFVIVGVILVLLLSAWRLWHFTVLPFLHPQEPRMIPYWIPCKIFWRSSFT